MICFEIAPLYDWNEAIKRAKTAAPQILAERRSENPKVMRQRLTAYLLLAKLCGGSLPQMTWSENGKPILCSDDRFCSLSHTDTGAAAVIADVPVGVDLQTVRNCSNRLAERVCCDTELALLRNVTSPDERDLLFTRIWSAKEAAVKVDGVGLAAVGLKNIAVSADLGSVELPQGRYALYMPQTNLTDTVCCIAFPTESSDSV